MGILPVTPPAFCQQLSTEPGRSGIQHSAAATVADKNAREVQKAPMIYVTEEAVERVSATLTEHSYDLMQLFKELKQENPRVAEYILCQSQKSKNSLEVIGTGIVVYLLLKMQHDLEFTMTPEDIGKFSDFIAQLRPEDFATE